MRRDGRVVMEAREAVRDAGLTVREAADRIHVAYETLRGYLYRGILPSLETTYYMAARIRRPIRLTGPHGTVVVKLEDERQGTGRKSKILAFPRNVA